MKKKLNALLAVAVLAVGVLSACSTNNNEPANNGKNNNTGNNGSTNVVEETDYSKGFPERVSLEIPVYDRAFEGWNVSDNYWTRWIQQEFGEQYNVDVKFVPIGRASEVTDFQQLLASGKAPDIIYHYDMPAAVNYYHAEVMQELDYEEIAKYAPTYWSNLQETNETYGKLDDKNTFFFAERPNFGNFVMFIRKDWVEAVDMKVEDLTSIEKYNELLVKWKEAGIGTGSEALIQNQFNYSGAFRPQPIDPIYDALYNDIAVADFTTEASEKFLRNLSYQYHNGLIDKEFYLRDTGEKVKAEFVAGRTGTFGEFIASNTDTFEATKKINPEAEFAVLPPGWNMPEGSLPYGGAPFPFGMIMGINHTSTEEERIAVWLYLEWMSQPDVLFTLQNGIDGENYNGLDENGVPIVNADYAGEALLSPNNNKDYWCLVIEAPTFGSEEQTIEALKSFWSPPGYEYIVDDLFKFREQTLQYQVPAPLFTAPIESVSKYRADLASLFQSLYLDIVLGDPAEFDAKYEAGKKQWLEAGYQEILDEKQKAIDEGKVVWNEPSL